ncbi:GDSL-type esterase/lipase family protein [Calothrix sp. UHCC 0171]|uniref:GDSL-type esterase/lipase family protein n=1 Tax=Calothrix sp. UHCC 0171 TaxID=3110245 RepID=UPI002B20F18D|nr:GDSL-type esterase/lipase family protein [Calothrix sp. UHCC 0171]MEA5572039.1 GDSL-type esterase/lipase family protein [Calothrix sp. UHCC 0171]
MSEIILLISVGLNIIFFCVTFIFIQKKGGFYYFNKKIFNTFRNQSEIFNIYNPPNYIHKKSQYELLPKPNNCIIFLGDSITDEGEWSELLLSSHIKSNILNRGISGDTTERILGRIDTIIAAQPQQIYLMVGINDFVMIHKSVGATINTYRQILTKIQNSIPTTQVFIQSILPVNNHISLYWEDNQKIVNLNSQLQELAAEFKYEYIDIHSCLTDSELQLDATYTSDGLHLNGKAYLIWSEIIKRRALQN